MDIWLYVGIFVIVDLALLTFAVVSRSRRVLSPSEKRRYLSHWSRIRGLDGRHAVMEADKLLDELLAVRGYKGTLGDKLKKAGPAFTNINDVWSAHKLRNSLAHQLDFQISGQEAKNALRQFAQAYKDLGLKV
jgi:hypothetical protein